MFERKITIYSALLLYPIRFMLKPAQSTPVEEAVRIFWQCDLASTKTILDSQSAAICSLAFETVKSKKFNGDFNKFIEW